MSTAASTTATKAVLAVEVSAEAAAVHGDRTVTTTTLTAYGSSATSAASAAAIGSSAVTADVEFVYAAVRSCHAATRATVGVCCIDAKCEEYGRRKEKGGNDECRTGHKFRDKSAPQMALRKIHN